jgi:hypothetical protein
MHVAEGFGGVERRRQDVRDQVLAHHDVCVVGAADPDLLNVGICLEAKECQETDDDHPDGDHQPLDRE